MLLVETYVRPSRIEGLGVFALNPIRKGTLIWSFNAAFDRLIPEAEICDLPPEVRKFVERYSYRNPKFPGAVVLEMDNGRFMNHSSRPNTRFVDPVAGYALRDIEAGAEITCNYTEIEPDFVLLPSLRARPPAPVFEKISATG